MAQHHLLYIDYSDEYRVGIKEMDLQHERLFTMYNNFVDSYNKNEGISFEDMKNVFNDMFWYTKYHFKEEEWIMRTYNYPNARDQVLDHAKIVATLTKIYTSSLDIDSMASALDTFIEIWATHILEKDRLYGEFIRTY